MSSDGRDNRQAGTSNAMEWDEMVTVKRDTEPDTRPKNKQLKSGYRIPKRMEEDRWATLRSYPEWLIKELLVTKVLRKVYKTGDTRPLKELMRKREIKSTRDKERYGKKEEMMRELQAHEIE